MACPRDHGKSGWSWVKKCWLLGENGTVGSILYKIFFCGLIILTIGQQCSFAQVLKAQKRNLQPPNQKSFSFLGSQADWPHLASKLFPEVEVIKRHFILFWMTIHQPGHISLKLKPQFTMCPMDSPAKTWPLSNRLIPINREALMIHPLPQNHFSILVVGSEDVESLKIWYKWPTHSHGEINGSLARTGLQCLCEWFTFGQKTCSLHHTGKGPLRSKRGTWVHRTVLGHG